MILTTLLIILLTYYTVTGAIEAFNREYGYIPTKEAVPTKEDMPTKEAMPTKELILKIENELKIKRALEMGNRLIAKRESVNGFK